MTHQEAIRILMLSPVYYKLTPNERNRLVKEYCRSFALVGEQKNCEKNKVSEYLFLPFLLPALFFSPD